MEDPEEAFNRGKLGLGVPVDRVPESTRFVGDVSMSASNASADGIVRLRQVGQVAVAPTTVLCCFSSSCCSSRVA